MFGSWIQRIPFINFKYILQLYVYLFLQRQKQIYLSTARLFWGALLQTNILNKHNWN